MSEAHSGRIHIAHQFESSDQQHEAGTLGIWIFLATEVMFFGGLFTGYALDRWLYYPAFAAASRVLDIRLGAINTAVLLTSSFTMALSVRAAQTAKRGALALLLILTMLLGAVFLGIKGFEYYQKFVEHVGRGDRDIDALEVEQVFDIAERFVVMEAVNVSPSSTYDPA